MKSKWRITRGSKRQAGITTVTGVFLPCDHGGVGWILTSASHEIQPNQSKTLVVAFYTTLQLEVEQKSSNFEKTFDYLFSRTYLKF